MARVGLVLGGGGTTGAAYHLGALLALEMATGWSPDDAEVIVGTSAGAFAAAMVRGGQLTLEMFLDGAASRDEVAKRLHERVYRKTRPRGILRWMRNGILPRLTQPDLTMIAGSPAVYTTDGIRDWVVERTGQLGETWPAKATVIVAYDLESGERTPFGTVAAPEVPLADAVAASAAVPMVFQPVELDGRWYLDGGLASGTSVDLVLGAGEPLDLVLVIAPMAAVDQRNGAKLYERIIDGAGVISLNSEIVALKERWPETDVVVLRPDESVLQVTRPNPLSTAATIQTFLRTLRSLETTLAEESTWTTLERHLMVPST